MIVTDANNFDLYINPEWLDIENVAYIIREDEDTAIVFLDERDTVTFQLNDTGHDKLCKLVEEDYARRRLINQSTQTIANSEPVSERPIKLNENIS